MPEPRAHSAGANPPILWAGGSLKTFTLFFSDAPTNNRVRGRSRYLAEPGEFEMIQNFLITPPEDVR